MLNNQSTIEFEQFLKTIDSDRERSAEKYLALRERLERFFEWRNCENAEELSDIVFDRVSRKIIEGEEIKNAEAYCVSVAKFVLMENRRIAFRDQELSENTPEINSTNENSDLGDEVRIKDKRAICLDKCLAEFPSDKRKLLIAYFDTDEKTMISTRKNLAKKLNVNLNTLRIRVSRLKTILEKCTKECCGET